MTIATKPRRKASEGELAELPPPDYRPRTERYAAGKALRDRVPRELHATWKPPAKRLDPIDVLEDSNRHRVPELVPIRHGRMLRSPFTFLRGAAGLMASDLAATPSTGLRVQACGDCHLLNFGLFATPERNLIFDINDFDETLPAPWEWDVKRLVASFAVAARESGCSEDEARDSAVACARTYREHLRQCSKMSPLEVWYERLDVQALIASAPDARSRRGREEMAAKAHERVGEHLYPKMTTALRGRHRLVDHPPILFHDTDKGADRRVRESMEAYRLSLPDDRRAVLDRYRLEDWAFKVVGIGSVGTRCTVGLFLSADGHPHFLQFKEACPSVLAPYVGRSIYENQGQRIVVGQRLMQSASDIFLGWTHGRPGSHFFGRQLQDMKFSIPLEGASARQYRHHAEVCGLVLARAHARSGDAATMSGYLGKTDDFDQAAGEFALAYADQTVRDHAELVAAVKAGRVKALVEKEP